jgi:outer membrane protein TolC
LIKTGSGVNQVATGVIPGGYADALRTMLQRAAFPRWNLTFNLSYPIGMSSAKATVARARIQLNQDQAQLKQIELQVATDITNAATNVQSGIERVQAAQASRELAQKQLDAETSKFEVGMSTNYNVVQSQRDLATAKNNELQAILNYRKSLVEIERLQQTTLQNLNITVVSSATR